MIYTVTDIHMNAVSVVYEDGTMADVPIESDTDLLTITRRIAEFDPDYLPTPTLNSNVTVGFSSHSLDPDSWNQLSVIAFGQAWSPLTTYAADYIVRNGGGTDIRDALDEFMLNIIGVPSTGLVQSDYVGFLSAISRARAEAVAISTVL